MSNGVNVDIEGFNELVEKIRKIKNDKTKKREIIGILRQVAGETVRITKKNAPISKKEHLITGKRSRKVIQPGNLKRSIGVIVAKRGKSGENPTIAVGARAGLKYKNDGFYGHMVEGGHTLYLGYNRKKETKYRKNSSTYVDGKFFMKKSFQEAKGKATAESEQRIAKYIQRKLDRL